jgi:hypothetical protein
LANAATDDGVFCLRKDLNASGSVAAAVPETPPYKESGRAAVSPSLAVADADADS